MKNFLISHKLKILFLMFTLIAYYIGGIEYIWKNLDFIFYWYLTFLLVAFIHEFGHYLSMQWLCVEVYFIYTGTPLDKFDFFNNRIIRFSIANTKFNISLFSLSGFTIGKVIDKTRSEYIFIALGGIAFGLFSAIIVYNFFDVLTFFEIIRYFDSFYSAYCYNQWISTNDIEFDSFASIFFWFTIFNNILNLIPFKINSIQSDMHEVLNSTEINTQFNLQQAEVFFNNFQNKISKKDRSFFQQIMLVKFTL